MALSRSGRAHAERTFTPVTLLLLRSLRENYYRGGWHGPSAAVREALRGLDANAASWRPGTGRHNIWELALHLAYARHMMQKRMGIDVPPFPRRLTKPWWPELPMTLTADAWAADLALLESLHRRLVAAVSGASRRLLATVRPGRSLTIGMEVLGVATHDAYHAGQMNMIRRIWEASEARRMS
ncbi:MAG TPA: DinB family protein [Gemmatimonadaceae bacterium]